MKMYSIKYIIFVLSFIMYFLIFIARPYITAQIWADIILCVFICAICYELLYVFYLHKYDNLKLLRALALYFLILSYSLEAYIIFYYANNFIYGLENRTFVTGEIIRVVYGIEAVISDGFAHLIFVPTLIISTIYQLVYFVITKKKPNGVRP